MTEGVIVCWKLRGEDAGEVKPYKLKLRKYCDAKKYTHIPESDSEKIPNSFEKSKTATETFYA